MNHIKPSLVTNEQIPLPEEHYRGIGIGSRSTFWRWEKEGLRVLKVGRRRFIYPEDLKTFMEQKDVAIALEK